ncbi:MAG: hypothetical protein NW216_04770 [Hyphomicrobium sp.]|nr:hypothetical protein [Hyphomicrobium sp.]
MLTALRLTPIPVTLAILSFIMPTELSLVLGDLRLSPHRVVFLIFFPFAVWRLLSNPACGLKAYDFPIFLLAAWQSAIFTYHSGNEGLAFGGSWALESLGGYLIARAYIRDLDALKASLKIVFASIVTAALIATLDSLTQSYFTHELLRAIVGGEPMPPVELRQGIARAASTFDHPIHYGTYCATMFALIWAAETKKVVRAMRAAVLAIAALLALSSAPLLSLGLQTMMLLWDRGTRGIGMRTQLTLAAVVGLYIGVAAVSPKSPIELLIVGATFDPWTGLYRIMIWTHGLENVWAYPFTGIGLAEWERPRWMVSSTIDAYWLVLPMRSGIPALLLLSLTIVMLGRGVIRRAVGSRDAERRRIGSGWMISLVAFCLLGATVHFWNVPHALFFFFIGLGSALADPRRITASARGTDTSIARTRPRHPSFGPFPVRDPQAA